MKSADVLLSLLLPSLIILHLLIAPYTKVEESFNLQATHDIQVYGVPTHDIAERLRATYDHVEFPGAVPRTFLGAVVLAGLSQPVLAFTGGRYGQFVVRAVLGLFNAVALLRYKGKVERAFGTTTARWFVLLLASQFHVLFYASRTLPNMFAFGLSTLALSCFLPIPPTKASDTEATARYHRLGIYYFVLAGVIFRSELALLLGTQLLSLLLMQSTPLTIRTLIYTGISAATFALLISVPVDSYFWQRPIWPELSGFIYNVFEGKSSDWGTSPWHAYFFNFLPKLLLNPMIIAGIPFSVLFTSYSKAAINLIIPAFSFIALYSIQPHKEARFIIYVVPPLTTCAALAAGYFTTHRTKSVLRQLVFLTFCASIPVSMMASTAMLLISSLNYPGGEALYTLHRHVSLSPEPHNKPLNVHMDVLSCMTGISRFQQDHPTPPFFTSLTNLLPSINTTLSSNSSPSKNDNGLPTFIYNKTESPTTLLQPEFWSQFDYILTSTPETVIGKWDIIATIYGYSGIEILKPGQVATRNLPVHGVQYQKLLGEEYDSDYVSTFEEEEGEQGKDRSREGDLDGEEGDAAAAKKEINRWFDKAKELGYYGMIREAGRMVTGGWWIGPRMEAKIWILKRAEGGLKGEWGTAT